MGAEVDTLVDVTDAVPPVQSVRSADLEGVVDELAAYHAHFAPLFARREQRVWAEVYLRGLLIADVPRKNIEALALRLRGAGPAAPRTVRALQQFIGEGAWDDAAILARHQRLVDETLGEDDGVLIVDGSEVPKRGTHSVGVAPPWCGATGKTDNCQAGVYLGYASRKGYTLLDRRLYLPAPWFAADHQALWQACAIPAQIPFHTKPQLAATMVEDVMRAQRIRARWVVCDEWYGQDPVFRERVAASGLWYLAEVPCDTRVWPLQEPATQAARARPRRWVPPHSRSGKGRRPTKERVHPASPPSLRVDNQAGQVPAHAWHRYRLLEGSKGPLVADVAAVRVVAARDGLPADEVWLLVRRSVPAQDKPPEDKFYLSNAPADLLRTELVRSSGMRWPIESCLEESKGEIGLDHYEVRFWRGWPHHMTLVILAHHFLVRLQQRLDQREGGRRAGDAPAGPGDAGRVVRSDAGPRAPERGAGALAVAGGVAAARLRCGGRRGLAPVPAAAQGGGLPLPSPAHPAPLGHAPSALSKVSL